MRRRCGIRPGTGVRGIADGIEEQAPQIAGVVRSAADGADNLSRQIRDQDFVELFDAALSFTRRRPAVAVGIGVFAGFLLSHLLNSGKPV